MFGTRAVLLLVEDNQTLRWTLRRHLQSRLPANLVEASTAAGALALAGRLRPDVVLLDLSLPDEPGVALLPRLRAINPAVRIVAMSDYLDRDYREELLGAGAWDYLPKEALGNRLEPVLVAALRASLPVPLAHWRAIRQYLGASGSALTEAIHWLDVHGPWAGKPRIRVLYLANVAMLVLTVIVCHQQL